MDNLPRHLEISRKNRSVWIVGKYLENHLRNHRVRHISHRAGWHRDSPRPRAPVCFEVTFPVECLLAADGAERRIRRADGNVDHVLRVCPLRKQNPGHGHGRCGAGANVCVVMNLPRDAGGHQLADGEVV